METLKLLRLSSRPAGDGGGLNLVSRRRRLSLRFATVCSGRGGGGGNSKCSSSEENWNDYRGGGVVFVGLKRPRLSGGQVCFFQQQQRQHLQRFKSRCGSGDRSYNSAAVAVVSDDDVEIHRKELLARYHWDEGFDAEIDGKKNEQQGADDEDTDENTEESGDYDFIRRRAAAGGSADSALRREENYQLEQAHWWMRLAVNVRRRLTPRTKGILLLNILTFLYGSNISIIKNEGTMMDPALFSVGRFAIASLVFTPFLSHALTSDSLRNVSFELGLLASAGYLTQCISVLTSDAARVSFISTFTVIVVPILASLSGAKTSKITWIAAATALIGVGILESNDTPFAIGDVWSFVSAVMFGVHLYRTEHCSRALAQRDFLPVMALQLVVITLCSGVWFCASHFNSGDVVYDLGDWNWPSVWQKTVSVPWLPMLYTGLLSTAFCLWTELVSMRDVKATEAAVIYTTEPLWGAAFAWLTLGERWGPNGWLGAFFILGGSLTMQLFGRPDVPAPQDTVLSPPCVDRVDAFEEKEQPFIITEAGDASMKGLHSRPQRVRTRVGVSKMDN